MQLKLGDHIPLTSDRVRDIDNLNLFAKSLNATFGLTGSGLPPVSSNDKLKGALQYLLDMLQVNSLCYADTDSKIITGIDVLETGVKNFLIANQNLPSFFAGILFSISLAK